MGSHHLRTAEATSEPSHRSPASDESIGSGSDVDLVRLIHAERAAAAYWRDVAEQRRENAAATQHRPMVRAAIAVDRESRPLQRRVLQAAEDIHRWWDRTQLRLLALPTLPHSTTRRRHLHSQVQAADRGHRPGGRTMDVLVVDLDRATALGASEVADRSRGGTPPTPGPRRPIAAEEVNRLVQQYRPDAICVLAGWAVPASPTWMQRLGDALTPEVAVAAPALVHPERPGNRTPHDLLTRSRGLVVDTVAGAPRPRSAGAGEPVDVTARAEDPVAFTSTCAMIDGDVWRRVGGLARGLDADAATIDICLRIGVAGGLLRSVPEVLVLDHRSVDGVDDLASEVRSDGRTWRALLDRHGPALRRLGSGNSRPVGVDLAPHPGPCSFTVTTAVPSAKLIHRWGDWPFAEAFAAALRRAGHQVLVQTLDRADDPAARANDVQVVIRGLSPVPRTVGQRQVLWLISHPESVTPEELDRADLVVVASRPFADHLRRLTSTPVEVLLQATDPTHFRIRESSEPRTHGVLVVANSRGVRRRAVADAESAGLSYSLVGRGWDDLVEPDRIVASHVDHEGLPHLYRRADLVLNDHWDTMAHWGFVSNRVLDVLACGTPVASDHVPELLEVFGDLVPTWRDPDELAAIVEDLRAHPEAARKRALDARDLVLEHHTFDHRAEELVELLVRHDLIPATTPT